LLFWPKLALQGGRDLLGDWRLVSTLGESFVSNFHYDFSTLIPYSSIDGIA
jgi:hypothetical protein